MGLGNPNALWLLLLVVPLVLAWRRKPRARVSVGNLFLWQQTQAPLTSRVGARVRRDWQLVAQVAFVAAAVAALARPVLPLSSGTVAVIVDLSASMGARDGSTTRLAQAVEAAIAIVESLPWRSRVQLIAARAVPQRVGEYLASDPRLPGDLRGLSVTAGGADIAAAIDVARAGGTAAESVYVLSDGPKAASVKWVRVGRPAANAAVTKLVVRRWPLAPADGQALVEVANFSTEPRETEVAIIHDGREIVRRPVRIAARGTAAFVADVPRLSGIVRAEMTAGDALHLDDVRYAAAPRDEPIRVLFDVASFFVEKALAANPSVTLDRVGAGGEYDIVVCERCDSASAPAAGILMIPSPAGSAAMSEAIVVADLSHPLLDGVDPSGLVAAPVPGAGRVGASAVLAYAGGEPALIAFEAAGRRVVELRVDVTDARFATNAAFPILVANAVDWLARRDDSSRQLTAGDPLQWVLHGAAQQDATVIGPAGVAVPAVVAGGRLTSAATHLPGVYVVRTPVAEERWMVNPATDTESDLDKPHGVTAESAAPALLHVESQQQFAPLLLLALGMLVAEWWIRCRLTRGVSS